MNNLNPFLIFLLKNNLKVFILTLAIFRNDWINNLQNNYYYNLKKFVWYFELIFL